MSQYLRNVFKEKPIFVLTPEEEKTQAKANMIAAKVEAEKERVKAREKEWRRRQRRQDHAK